MVIEVGLSLKKLKNTHLVELEGIALTAYIWKASQRMTE